MAYSGCKVYIEISHYLFPEVVFNVCYIDFT
jgi:hypothetical protein